MYYLLLFITNISFHIKCDRHFGQEDGLKVHVWTERQTGKDYMPRLVSA